ncbi:hypothetical protein CROQUDRAFT_684658 [Cronartium quercuum f. sp. fusiforme G11]|uniref:Aquaporin n=1 Tax=Cronartium quercuum f. sp. fusiforme G11 TaxID=708437 RepID=A0A9P6TGI1_9BASI|nr:hypothetical protein CROQUDRAFT_684658 [Cronartium quercuum f. sp. fusiforme G11]
MELLPIWKASIFEGLGSLILIWFIGIASPVFTLNSPVGVGAGLAFLYGSAVALIMFALKPITGAHINPFITLSHLLVGTEKSLFRGGAYILSQMIGAVIGGGFVAGALGSDAVALSNGGCVVDSGNTGMFKPQQAVALEFMAALVLLVLAHSKFSQSQPHSTSLTPFLYGLSVGLLNFCTSGFAPHAGYIGSFGFPNVCFGLSMGIMKFQPVHWVFWIPGFAAVILHGAIYRFLKPYDSQNDSENSEMTGHKNIIVPFPSSVFQRDQKGSGQGFETFGNSSVV